MVECVACGGRYEPISGNSIRYFHVCPPKTLQWVKRNGAPLEVDLADVRETDIVPITRNGVRQDLPSRDVAADDVLIGRRDVPRDGHRNENVARVVSGKAVLVDEGLGVRVIPADDASSPAFPPLKE